MDVVWRLALREMAVGAFAEIEPEHFCAALLKFSELAVEAAGLDGDGADLASLVARDAREVRDELARREIDSKRARRRLRELLGPGDSPYQGGEIHRSAASKAAFDGAVALAARAEGGTLTPLCLFAALLQRPTPVISRALGGPSGFPDGTKLPLLERHGRDLGGEAMAGGPGSPDVDVQAKAVLGSLAESGGKSVLLVSESDEVVRQLALVVAKSLAGGSGPAGAALGRRRLVAVDAFAAQPDAVGGPRVPERAAVLDLDRFREILDEVAPCPEILLLLPPIDPASPHPPETEWVSLLQETLVRGRVRFLCRVSPASHALLMRRAPVWKRRTRVVWLHAAARDQVPTEL